MSREAEPSVFRGKMQKIDDNFYSQKTFENGFLHPKGALLFRGVCLRPMPWTKGLLEVQRKSRKSSMNVLHDTPENWSIQLHFFV